MATTLSDLLESVRLRGTNWIVVEMTDKQALSFGECNEVVLHFVVEGQAHLSTGSGTLTLPAGAGAILLHGCAHRLETQLNCTNTWVLDFASNKPRDIPSVVRFGKHTGAPGARVIVGKLKVDVGPSNPILSLVPDLLSLQLETTRPTAFNPKMIGEFAGRPGALAYLTRLGDILLVRALQNYTSPKVQADDGIEAALGASRVLRAVNSIRENPGAPWTVTSLARLSCMSRSSFAAEFVRVMGMSPMRHVAQQRLEIAAARLARGPIAVNTVARWVGYKSEATFARRFKRRFGLSPGEYRNQVRGEGRNSRDSVDTATSDLPHQDWCVAH